MKKASVSAFALAAIVSLTVSCVPPKTPDQIEAMIEKAQSDDNDSSAKVAK